MIMAGLDASADDAAQELDGEQLIAHLQSVSGLALRTPAEARAYRSRLQWPDPLQHPSVRAWLVAKRCTWLILLSAAFMQYHLLDAMNEAITLNAVAFVAPPAGASGTLLVKGTARSR